MVIMSLLDLFSGYDQIELHFKLHDMTAFQILLSLLQQMILLMRVMNLVV